MEKTEEIKVLIDKAKKLVDKYGENGILHTFDLCMRNAIRLGGFAVDTIQIDTEGNVRCIFGTNKGNSASIDSFDKMDIKTFLSGISNELFWQDFCTHVRESNKKK